jgi:hypothetical protein
VPLRGRLGDQQEDQQADGLVVRRVEGNRLLHAQHRRERVLQPLMRPWGNRHAVAQAGGAQPFAGKQGCR